MKSMTHVKLKRLIFCAAPVIAAAILMPLLFQRPSSALVEELYTLERVMNESTTIAEGVIESVDQQAKMIVVKVNSTLKGTCPLKEIKMNIGVGQLWHPQAMMKQAKVGEPVVIFYNAAIQSECYTNNFFFQFNGNLDPKGQWPFTHIELRMNRTYNAPVQTLLPLLKDIIAGKVKAPPPDKAIPPISQSELMGNGIPPGAVSDDPDGYEAYPDWKNEEWANPTEAQSVAYIEPGAPPDPGPQPGLLAEYYNIGGQIAEFPDVKALRPSVKRVDKQINVENSGGPIPGTELANHLFVCWKGLLRVQKPGKYKLTLASDDGSRMFFNGKPLIENGGDHGTIEKTGEVDLKPGDHEFKVEFYQNGGPYECKLYWEGPEIAKALIPAEALFHNGYFGPRGQVLRIKLAEGAKGKLAVTRLLEEDCMKHARLLFEAENQSEKTVKVAWAFQMKDGLFYESLPVDVPPGKWHYGHNIDFGAATFKTKASEWKNTAEWASRSGVGAITCIVYDSPAKGTLNIDRVRFDKGAIFVRSIPLAMPTGRGVSFMDYDGDGNLDALLCAESGNKLFQNKNNTFSDVTAAVGLSGGSRTAAWADLDGDGQLELLYGTPTLWNFKDGKFTANKTLLPLQGSSLECVGFLDVNGDGKTDVLTARGAEGLQLLLNEGKSFKDATAAFGLGNKLGAGTRNAFAITDCDDNGFPEVLCNQGKGLLLSAEDGGSFKVAANSKIDYASGHTLGVAFGDFDNDGSINVFIPQTNNGKQILLKNKDGKTFVNVTDDAGALAILTGNARSAVWGDVNLDGFLDLVISFTDAPTVVMLGNGKGKFAPSPFSLAGFDCASNVAGMALGDFDNDGDLDLLVVGEKGGGIIVNEASRIDRYPLRVRPSFKKAPGTIVRLYDETGNKRLGTRVLGLVSNIGSQEPTEAFFAVMPGKYKLEVLFSDGENLAKTVALEKPGLIWNIEDAKKK